MSKYYGPVSIAAGQKTIIEVGAAGIAGAILGNESGLTVKVTLDGTGHSQTLYPGTVDFFPIPDGQAFNGNVIFEPSALLSNVNSWPGSFIQVDTLAPGEQAGGTFPFALPRNTNVGNAVNTNMVSSTLINDGNPAGTQIGESTPAGDASSAFSLTNSGVLTLGSAARTGILASSEVQSNVYQDAAGDGVLSITGSAGTQNTRVQAGGQINLQVPAGVSRVTIDSGGPSLANGATFGFLVGSLSRISKFSGNPADSAFHSYAHGLGVKPDIVLVQVSDAGGTATTSWNPAATDGTNASIAVFNGLAFTALAIKF